MDIKNIFNGSCHCGNVQLSLETEKSLDALVPRECGCSLCKRHGATWISDPAGHLELRYGDPGAVNAYQFGHKTSDFIICKNCGVLLAALCDVDGTTKAVINTKSMLDCIFPTMAQPMDFDGESVDGRLDRRAKNWTGQVTVKNQTN